MPHKPYKTATLCANAQVGTDSAFNAVIPPLYLSSTYKFNGLEDMGRYDYGRSGNPNRDGLADAVSKLEGAAGGVVTSSGMAAIDLVLNVIPAGSTVVAPHDCYGGTHRLLRAREKQGRCKVEFVDQSNLESVKASLADQSGILLIETPSNPLMRVVDIAMLCKIAHDAGILVICDNTFLSPARQLPFSLGADFVIHSSTKYINDGS
ncbi:MAG: aminotransferase class I/II-fold pyridoxal phosphate-dependent enzyme [Acidimicrobiales bacterium]|nr:MAG: aminotransferase class I/II-fold pyridoxal phosphate-dependent enzyme [Acidimicrobiales bacterium]